MRRAAQGQGIYRRLAEFGRQQQSVIRRVLAAVHERGALGAGNWQTSGESRSLVGLEREKHALEWLFATGEVTVATRRGFERLYDLPERVLPAELMDRPELEESEAQRRLLLRSADALGVATEQDLRDYYRLETADCRTRLNELIEIGELLPIRVQGWKQTAYCRGEPKPKRRIEANALLSPFDSLVWARARTERLFGFRYRLEIYTPAHKRSYGYYVLPFLHDERLAGRVDLRSERRHGRLAVHAVHTEAPELDDAELAALVLQLRELADWLELPEIALHCPSATAARLRSLL